MSTNNNNTLGSIYYMSMAENLDPFPVLPNEYQLVPHYMVNNLVQELVNDQHLQALLYSFVPQLQQDVNHHDLEPVSPAPQQYETNDTHMRFPTATTPSPQYYHHPPRSEEVNPPVQQQEGLTDSINFTTEGYDFSVAQKTDGDCDGSTATADASSSTLTNQENDSDDCKVFKSKYFKDSQGDKWNKHFEDLLEYRATHGHCNVPFKPSTSLAQWVKRQRHQFRLKLLKQHSTLTTVRQQALERVGFVWDAQSIVWEERFKELKAFKKQHGHCNVSSSYKANQKLAVWVKSQRRQYKTYQKDPTHVHTPIVQERYDRLEELGFEWKRR